MTKRKSREKVWRVILAFLIFIELGIIGLFAYQIYADSLVFPFYQLGALLFLSVWIYIAFLKQRTVEVSEHAINEKVKTHAILESIPLGAIILDRDNEIMMGNAMASSLIGKEIMLAEDHDLEHCLPYDIMKIIYGNQWGGYVTRGLEGLIDITVTISPIRDQNREIIGKLLIIQGVDSRERQSEGEAGPCEAIAEICLKYVKDTEAVLRPAKPEAAQGTRIRSLLVKNILSRERALANVGKTGEQKLGTLNDVLIRIITEAKSAYASKGMNITTEIRDQLILKAPENFLQALRELIVNSLLFSPEGSIVTVASRIESDFFEISVKDSGIGMNQELLAQVFTENCVGGNSDVFSGYRKGKGLYAVKTLLEEVGVSVRVESKEGVGTMVVMSGQRKLID